MLVNEYILINRLLSLHGISIKAKDMYNMMERNCDIVLKNRSECLLRMDKIIYNCSLILENEYIELHCYDPVKCFIIEDDYVDILKNEYSNGNVMGFKEEIER